MDGEDVGTVADAQLRQETPLSEGSTASAAQQQQRAQVVEQVNTFWRLVREWVQHMCRTDDAWKGQADWLWLVAESKLFSRKDPPEVSLERLKPHLQAEIRKRHEAAVAAREVAALTHLLLEQGGPSSLGRSSRKRRASEPLRDERVAGPNLAPAPTASTSTQLPFVPSSSVQGSQALPAQHPSQDIPVRYPEARAVQSAPPHPDAMHNQLGYGQAPVGSVPQVPHQASQSRHAQQRSATAPYATINAIYSPLRLHQPGTLVASEPGRPSPAAAQTSFEAIQRSMVAENSTMMLPGRFQTGALGGQPNQHALARVGGLSQTKPGHSPQDAFRLGVMSQPAPPPPILPSLPRQPRSTPPSDQAPTGTAVPHAAAPQPGPSMHPPLRYTTRRIAELWSWAVRRQSQQPDWAFCWFGSPMIPRSVVSQADILQLTPTSLVMLKAGYSAAVGRTCYFETLYRIYPDAKSEARLAAATREVEEYLHFLKMLQYLAIHTLQTRSASQIDVMLSQKEINPIALSFASLAHARYGQYVHNRQHWYTAGYQVARDLEQPEDVAQDTANGNVRYFESAYGPAPPDPSLERRLSVSASASPAHSPPVPRQGLDFQSQSSASAPPRPPQSVLAHSPVQPGRSWPHPSHTEPSGVPTPPSGVTPPARTTLVLQSPPPSVPSDVRTTFASAPPPVGSPDADASTAVPRPATPKAPTPSEPAPAAAVSESVVAQELEQTATRATPDLSLAATSPDIALAAMARTSYPPSVSSPDSSKMRESPHAQSGGASVPPADEVRQADDVRQMDDVGQVDDVAPVGDAQQVDARQVDDAREATEPSQTTPTPVVAKPKSSTIVKKKRLTSAQIKEALLGVRKDMDATMSMIAQREAKRPRRSDTAGSVEQSGSAPVKREPS